MTIKQFAQEHGVSCQAVYQRLKRNKLKVETLINGENPSNKRELSEDGLNTLNQLFINKESTLNDVEQQVDKHVDTGLRNQIETLTAEVEQLTRRVKELEIENARLTGKLEAYEATSATLAATQEKTAEALATAQRLMDQQQQLHAMQIKALPGGGVRGWFSKIFNRKGDSE